MEEVLWTMKVRPFLCHRRANKDQIEVLEHTLRLFGVQAWRDLSDLRLGADTRADVERAIRSETGGFIWWGTHQILESAFVRDVELPLALSRKEEDSLYAVVPVFVSIDPNKNGKLLRSRLGDNAERLLACNGELRRADETIEALAERVATRYLRDKLRTWPHRERAPREVSMMFRSRSAYAQGDCDLIFDWRELFCAEDGAYVATDTRLIRHILESTVTALQAHSRRPPLVVDSDLPLPVATLLGYHFNKLTRLSLSVRQDTTGRTAIMPTMGIAEPPHPPVRDTFAGGPTVLAVSAGGAVALPAERYATRVDARELILYQDPRMLNAQQMRGLADAVGAEMETLSQCGHDVHLLLRGPTALAIAIGTRANTIRRVLVPYWNNQDYFGGVEIGSAAVGESGH